MIRRFSIRSSKTNGRRGNRRPAKGSIVSGDYQMSVTMSRKMNHIGSKALLAL
jgi:hypothetical protein